MKNFLAKLQIKTIKTLNRTGNIPLEYYTIALGSDVDWLKLVIYLAIT